MRKLVTLLSIAAFAATTGDRSLMDAVKQGDTAAALSMLKHDAVALFWPFAAVSHQAHFDLAEISVGYRLLIAHDTQLRKQRRQLAGVEHHTGADRSALVGVTMEAFDDENSARFESSLDDVRDFAASHITEQN